MDKKLSFKDKAKSFFFNGEEHCLPQKEFGSADCVQRYRWIVYIVSQTADPNPFSWPTNSS